MSEYEKALLNPKTPKNAKILLENLSEKNCRKYCEEDGNCFDCYIDFEQVQALDFIREENERLQQENERNKYILTEFEKWLEEKIKCTEQYADNDMAKGYINAIKLCKYYLQELKEGKK